MVIFVRLLSKGKVVRAGTGLKNVLKVEAMGVNADFYFKIRGRTP